MPLIFSSFVQSRLNIRHIYRKWLAPIEFTIDKGYEFKSEKKLEGTFANVL